jgi:UDP-N-acetylglucosamine--N-acetylmuramyl-(pentapeptide) pyrophosphoryl-undecaprenol N-acetylglucosamine transferase
MKTLLVASEGGHLAQLYLLSECMAPADERVWVTFDTPQSRSLLAGQDVHFAPFAGTRDLVGTARAAMWAREFLRTNHFDTVVSTGASIALAVLPLAARTGAKCFYIESATRTDRPSLTGRLLTPFHSIHLRTQHERWADQRWTYQVSIFDGFRSFPASQPSEPRRVVVSLGMHKGFGFRRLLEQLIRIIPHGTDVLWQVGYTDTSGLGIDSQVSLPAPELSRAMAESDVVITHAGIGSAISALEAGKRPVFVPRRKRFKEHVDDHQAFIATELDQRKLAFRAEADELQWDEVVQAASWRAERDTQIRTTADLLCKKRLNYQHKQPAGRPIIGA